MKHKLIVPGNVNEFCPNCGKILWEEWPDKNCSICDAKINHSKKKEISEEKLKELVKEYHVRDCRSCS